ncbi:hypothetical protein Pelo_15188 [Pelomyxa schiedti]|nr:hypothetical protein Pelo_15188 [Pelomyxa schiedti]
MDCAWPLVVDSVSLVLTPEMLSSTTTHIYPVVYATEATKVTYTGGHDGLIEALRVKHKPKSDLTMFRTAFRMTTDIVREALSSTLAGISHDLIDVRVLLFTDGHDTSIWKNGTLDAAASTASARKHYDAMIDSMRSVGVDVFVYVAAYSPDHDPEQCQAMSHKYCYIDRTETLKARLATLMGEMLEGTGVCSLRVLLPPAYSLLEPIPAKLPLNGPELLYYVFLSGPKMPTTPPPTLRIELSTAGAELQETMVQMVPTPLLPASFRHHNFVLDYAACRLRQKSRSISGHASAADIQSLRELLDTVRKDVAPTRVATVSPYRGASCEDFILLLRQVQQTCSAQLILSRAQLISGLDIIDILADRLSHVVNDYEQHQMTDVRVNAILGDSRQHLPTYMHCHTDTTFDSVWHDLSLLPPPKEVYSPERTAITIDRICSVDAHFSASHGDAHFFYAKEVTTKHGMIVKLQRGEGCISFKSFTLLANHSERYKKPLIVESCPLKAPYLPCYFSTEHFQRSCQLAPIAMGFVFHDASEPALPPLEETVTQTLGFSAIQGAASDNWLMLLHEMRSLHALLQFRVHPGSTPKYTQFEQNIAQVLYTPLGVSAENSLHGIIANALLCRKAINPSKLSAVLLYHSLSRALAFILRNASNPNAELKTLQHLLVGVFSDKLSAAISSPKTPHLLNAAFTTLAHSIHSLPFQKIAPFLSHTIPTTVAFTIINYIFSLCNENLNANDFPEFLSIEDIQNSVRAICAINKAKESFGDLHAIFEVVDQSMLCNNPRSQEQLNSILKLMGSCAQEASEALCSPETVWASLFQASVVGNAQESIVNNSSAYCIQHAFRAHKRWFPKTYSVTMWQWKDPSKYPHQIYCAAMHYLFRNELARIKQTNAQTAVEKQRREKELETRRVLIKSHPISAIASTKCWCGLPYSETHRRAVWGEEAYPDDAALHRTARLNVLRAMTYRSAITRSGEIEREYRQLGGTYSFRFGDTYIRGLHQRTRDYFHDHQRQPKADAVTQVMLRLKWDDRIPGASARLQTIIDFLWDCELGKGRRDTVPSSLYDF